MEKQWEQDAEYDIALLEEKNGIQATGAYQIQEKGTTEQLEEKLGVSSKEEEGKKLPKERVEPEGHEKTAYQAQKYCVKGTSYKDNVKRKDKNSGRMKAMKNAAKKELKSIFVKQILEEKTKEEQEKAAEDFGNAIAVDFFKSAGKLGFQVMIKAIISLLGVLFTFIIGLVSTIVLAIPLFICVVALICVLVAATLISGIFVSPQNVAQDDFAVNRIVAHQNSLIKEAESYNGKKYGGYNIEKVVIRYDGISNISSNSDDILLIYMTEAADIDKIMETDGTAPLMNVNTLNERWAMNSALKNMLYISDVKYEKCKKKVTVEIPVSSSEEGGSTSQTKTITMIKYYYKATVTITGMSAKEWELKNAGTKEISIYSFLRDVFNSFGYKSLGGNSVCQKYLNANLE